MEREKWVFDNIFHDEIEQKNVSLLQAREQSYNINEW